VWQAFVDPRVIEQWGGGPDVRMNDQEGGKFNLWGGDIHGTNTKVVEHKLLEQDWYGGDWDEPSKVVFSFTAEGNRTVVMLVHSNVPDAEAKDFDQGWKDYYLGAIKELLET
jgi:uncharacterized protein YndB with AHSA1/START domain